MDWQGTTRLVGYVAKGDHGTYPSAGKHHVLPLIEDQTSPIGEGFSWPTWQMLVPLESQPWAGFCGAWGKVGKSIPGTDLFGASERTGPLGPGCLAGGQRQYKTGRPRPWGASRSSPADRAAQVGTAVGVGL